MAVMQDRDKLCPSCINIPPIKEIVSGYDENWSSFQQFKSSALNGCPLCSYLYSGSARFAWDTLEASEKLDPGPPFSLKWNGHIPLVPTQMNADPNMLMEHTHGFEHPVLYSIFVSPAIDHNPTSDQVFAKIRGWIASCSRNHSSCHLDEDALLPRFSIEIHSNAGTKPSLRLFENDKLSNKKALYIALSYIWGIRPQPVQLMKENIQKLKDSIDYDELPKTIQDVIRVAQGLGVQYVWVDALCIVQDDGDFKKEQIGQMKNIYGNAYLTVQAGNVKTVKESFLRPRSSPRPFKLNYDDESHVYLRGYTPSRVAGGSARTRAWVFQESVLPNRLLVYGEHQIVFQCREEIQYEDGLRTNSTNIRHSETPMFLKPGDWRKYIGTRVAKPRPPPDRRLDFLSAWYSAIDDVYTTRMLTYTSDRLPAINGISLRLQEEIGGRYVAGIWESDLPWGLLWESKNSWRYPAGGAGPTVWKMRRPENTRAPSWSWAAVDGSTRHKFWRRHNDTRDDEIPVASVCMDSYQADIAGEIVNSDGMLQINAPLIYTSVVCYTDSRYKGLRESANVSLGYLGYQFPALLWDTPKERCGGLEELAPASLGNEERPIALANFDIEDEQTAYPGVWCALICRSQALMLECLDEKKKTFRRLGAVHVLPEIWPYSATEKARVDILLI
ncbi:HET domain protein [Penicillium verhagenii]|nr:HET domain protein [Penicillium verhagenii]